MKLCVFAMATVLTGSMLIELQTPQPDTVVLAGRLWTGSGDVIQRGAVFLRQDRILGVGPAPTTLPAGAKIIDLSPFTVTPGLIDVHTHMTYGWDRTPGTTPLKQGRRDPARARELALANGRATLETGVTTIRDLGAGGGLDIALRDAIARGELVGPRMFVAGQGISAGRDSTTLDALRALAVARLATPADWVKVYASRGSYSSVDTTQTMALEALQAVVRAAHDAGRPVAIHSYGASGVRDAVLAGADSVEHGIGIDDETLREMAKRGTVWVPTIDHNRYYIDAQAEFGFPDDSIPPLRAYIQENLETARRAIKAGVRLAMGSDAVFTMFGQNTRELEWFVKAGMTPEQALISATRTGAELLRAGDRLGRLAPGYVADLVAIDGNPLSQIGDLLTGVRWVLKDGKVVVDKR
jgi:imidazolonepropionase-like amidohydrolase